MQTALRENCISWHHGGISMPHYGVVMLKRTHNKIDIIGHWIVFVITLLTSGFWINIMLVQMPRNLSLPYWNVMGHGAWESLKLVLMILRSNIPLTAVRLHNCGFVVEVTSDVVLIVQDCLAGLFVESVERFFSRDCSIEPFDL